VSARPNAGNGTAGKRWVAVEGPCCAGKTTLSRGLLSEMTGIAVSHVHCYADHVGGGRFLPRPVPQSLREDQEAVDALLAVEADRVAQARADASELVLMDRSVHTLLAHRYALQRVTGLALLTPAQRVITQSQAPAWPDLVLYLDVPQQTILDRNRGKFAPDSIFIDPAFNTGVRGYFCEVTDPGNNAIVWLDATLEPATLMRIAEGHVRGLLQGHDT
jgi:thymidylate kinase